MKKVIVIGSNGFIGNSMLKYFSNQTDFECWGCDVSPNYGKKQYFQIDSSNADFSDVFENGAFFACINCSGAGSVPDSFKNPLRDFSLNVLNVSRILEAIRKYTPECLFINMSSAAVYGNPQNLPIKENNLLAPVSPYGIHKMQSEQICAYYNRFWDLRTCSLRIFSAYGPGLKKQLFWDLYQKSLKTTHVELFGTGKESRDFIYVEDIVQCVELSLLKGSFRGETVNVANGYQCTTAEAADKLFYALGWKGSIEFNNQVRAGDPLNWEADISIIKDWGYVSKFDLKSGIKKYVQWLRELE